MKKFFGKIITTLKRTPKLIAKLIKGTPKLIAKLWVKTKEFIRKKIVALKRSPNLIAMLLILVSCIFYTCSLGGIADSVVLFSSKKLVELGISYPFYAQLPSILLFVTTLFSILSFISYFSSYPRGKCNKFMLSLTLLMLALMFVCDLLFILAMNYYKSLGDVILSTELAEHAVASGLALTIVHMVLLVISALAACLTPVFGKLLGFINTDVVDEYDTLMEQKSEEELMLELEDEN